MRRHRASCGIGVVLLGIALALAPAAMASASKNANKPAAKHHKKKAKKTRSTTATTSPSKSASTVKVGPLTCPNQSLITAAAGTTWTGPSTTNGGTAACIYTDSAGDELNVILNSPTEPVSKFIATDPADIGVPATPVSGIGKAAFETTTNGHAEVDVYQSSSKGFAVTLDPANVGTVTTADLTQVEAVATAYANQ
jgi:hypothetical protein